MHSVTSKILTASASALLIASTTAQVMAGTRWERTHPRRDQVNDRLERQNWRIRDERREGDITKSEAQHLHAEDRQIRQEERDMASQNGGHITRDEQRVLNEQENKVGREIGK